MTIYELANNFVEYVNTISIDAVALFMYIGFFM